MKLDYCNILDKIGNDMSIIPVHLSRKSMVDDAISTGSLVCDLIIGGGWPAGRWVTLFGQEASAKSTLLYHTLGNVIRNEINAEFLDFEGSTDPSYINKIIGLNLSSVFGARKENGAWEIAPKCRYYQPDIGEIYFRYIHRILKILPDKMQHNNKWYYVMDKKPNKELFDEKLYKRTKRYWIPCEDSGSQLIWFIDSLPAMLTETMDEKDESKEIGLQARMFSKYIPLIKSRLARKRCSIVAVNQIRFKPMAWGDPTYEPGGEAPKFYCVTGDTYLQTNKGLITIEEAYKFRMPPTKLLSLYKNEKPNLIGFMGDSKTIKVTNEYGYSIEGKPNHKILAINKYGILNWYNLSEINNKFHIALKYGSDSNPDSNIYAEKIPYMRNIKGKKQLLTFNFARFLGYISSKYTSIINYTLIFKKKDYDVMSDFCRCFMSCFPGLKFLVKQNTKTRIFESNDILLINYLKSFNIINLKDKKIPQCIAASPKKFIIEYLKGYFTGNLTLTTKSAEILDSKEFIKQLHLILLNMGIISKLNVINRKNVLPTYESSLCIKYLDLKKLLNTIPLISKKRYTKFIFENNSLREIVPVFKFWDSRRLFKNLKWIEEYKNGLFYKEFLISKLDSLNKYAKYCSKINEIRYNLRIEIADSIRKITNYMNNNICFLKVRDIEHSIEKKATYDFNMPSSTIITNGIVSHNSDIRLKCTSCSNPFPGKSGQIEEEKCWDGIGIDKYRYIKINTKKNKCFSPFRNSLMRVWLEEKGDIGRGIDPVFDTMQYLQETGQAEKLRGDQYIISLPGPWNERKWKWQEIKELLLNPNKAEVYEKYNFNLPEIGKIDINNEKSKEILDKELNIRQKCFDQIKNDEAFKLYFENSIGKNSPNKDISEENTDDESTESIESTESTESK